MKSLKMDRLKVVVVLMVLLAGLAVGIVGALVSQNAYLKQKLSEVKEESGVLVKSKKKTVEVNEEVYRIGVYVFGKPYELVFQYSLEDKYERWLLRVWNDPEDIVLMEGEYRAAQVSNIVFSPGNSKLVTTMHVGDSQGHFLMGVETNESRITGVMEPVQIKTGEAYGVGLEFMTWIDEERVLVRRTDYDVDPRGVSYFVAPIGDLSQRNEVSF